MALGAAARSYFVWGEPIDRVKRIFEARKRNE
jgi:hypothetical protein